MAKSKKEEDDTDKDSKAPDGGWGWVVAAGVFLIALVVPMLSPSFGILFSRQLVEWHASSTTVAVVFNSFMVVWRVVGVMLGSLTREFGYRKVAMTGTLLTAICLTISALAASPTFLFVSFSLGCGVGSGLSCVGYLILAQYFHRRRGLANAWLMAGAGMGHFFSPLLIRCLQDHYGLQGAIIIVGAIILHGFLGATVFHPVEWHCRHIRHGSRSATSSLLQQERYSEKCGEVCNRDGHFDSVRIVADERMQHDTEGERNWDSERIVAGERMQHKTESNSDRYLHSVKIVAGEAMQHYTDGNTDCTECDQCTSSCSQSTSDVVQTVDSQTSPTDKRASLIDNRVSLMDKRDSVTDKRPSFTENRASLTDCRALFTEKEASFTNIKASLKDSRTSLTDKQLIHSEGGNRIVVQERLEPCGVDLCRTVIHVIRAVVSDLGILRRPSCLIIALGSTFIVNGEANFTVMVPFAIQAAGHSLQTAAWCVSVAGMCSFCSRLLVSPMSDMPWFNMRLFYMAAIATMGISIIVFTFQTSAVWQAGVMGVWGVAIGTFYGLNNLLMTRIIGLQQLTSIYSAKNFLVAVGFFSIGPFIGVIRDLSGSYAISMWVLAALILTSFLMWFFMPAAIAYDRRNRRTAATHGGDLQTPEEP